MKERVFARSLAVAAVAALGAAGATGTAHAAVRAAATESAMRAGAARPDAARTGTARAGRLAGAAKPYDFNGDGHPDLALGSPDGTVGTASGAGFVTIVYGSSAGMNTADKQVISQSTAGVPGTPEAGDHFGFSLTSFDYDGDGYADLIIGAPDEDTDAGANAGSETVLWGGSTGLTGDSSYAIAEPQNEGANHRFGYALAAADFEGDGYMEWADTSPGDGYFWVFTTEQPTGVRSARARPTARGRQVRGGGRRLAATAPFDALTPATGDVDGDHKPDLVVAWYDAGADPADRYGFDVWTDPYGTAPAKEVLTRVDGLAVADFDGDGYADVATGASDDEAGGHVTVFKGGSLDTSYALDRGSDGVPGDAQASDRFGAALSAGDVTGDGRADLAVGVPGRTVDGAAGAGEVVLLYGSASGLTGTGSQAVSQNTTDVPGAAEAGDSAGSAVALLDVTGDGHADLIAGAPKENDTDGAVSFLPGGTSGVTGTGSVTPGAKTLGIAGKNAQVGKQIGRVG